MVQSVITAAGSALSVPHVSVPIRDACADLLELFAAVSDGRSDQGRDHPVAVVLALSAAAVVAGMSGYTAIAGWIADVPIEVRQDLYARVGADTVAGPPSKSTIWRVLTDTDPQAFDVAVGTWLRAGLAGYTDARARRDGPDPVGLMQVRLDGKTIRGARDPDGNQRHLLAALLGRAGQPSVIAAQTEVGAKTNEVPMAATVLDQIGEMSNTVVTADALHTVKATANQILMDARRYRPGSRIIE